MSTLDPQLSPQLADALHRITAQGLSTASRVGHVALLLVALGMGIVIASLLATEPSLPPRTVAAFTLMLAIAASWVAYATWVLRRRHPLMAQHRVIATRMAVTFCLLFTAAALAAGIVAQSAAGFLAAATGAGLLIAAMLLLRGAQRERHRLRQRCAQLAQEAASR